MKMIPLGRTDIMVSDWCLGTMTYGNQTPQDDAHTQIDMAVDAGINFLDTAEMYPVNPIRAETVGLSEQVIGNWIAKTGRRDDIVIATKVSGDNPGWVREGRGYDGAVIREAVDTSLKRLQTDVIDLYQMHWPLRGSYMFRQNWTYDPSGQNRQDTLDHMMDVLTALGDCVKAGKIKAIGMSNESAWGMTKWIDQAECAGLPRMASVQNEYSLLCRLYDTDMAEMAVNEDVTLLSFSPLACGLLTGKYQNGAVPDGSRMAINGDLGGRKSPRVFEAMQAYLDLSAEHGLDPVHMAMAWQRTRPFAVSAIFGATTAAQLDRILAGADVVLSDEVVGAIDNLNRAHPMPY
ncbi:aldo/keto reductase [Yoonia sp. SDW83-1]|uniref:aldo/keto reductase n=1 Tax=Yoonia sp. SDW83-1 TaxID=3366945 RepID=UPI00398C34CC